MKISVEHAFLPKVPSTRSVRVMDHFGIRFEQGTHIIARDLEVPLQAGEVLYCLGDSGSGKSSLLRAVAAELQGAGASLAWVRDEPLPDRVLVDLLPLELEQSLPLLTQCGLGEAHLLLRTPAELSDGQRARFRLALALSTAPDWVVIDELTATLDRRLACVIAANLRRIADRTPTGFLCASTHEDVLEDLQPDVLIRCSLGSGAEVSRRDDLTEGETAKKKVVTLARELWISSASKRDWPYFARWHYRSHRLGLIRNMFLLWHGADPVGICIFVSPPKCLSQRNRYFGRSGSWNRTALRALNSQLVMLSRVVLHPTFRGSGLGHHFVRRCCELCPSPWIEALTEMGHFNPFFERAGFLRIGSSPPLERSREAHSKLYGSRRHGRRQALLTEETFEKSRFAEPVYYIFDNRAQGRSSDGNHLSCEIS